MTYIVKKKAGNVCQNIFPTFSSSLSSFSDFENPGRVTSGVERAGSCFCSFLQTNLKIIIIVGVVCLVVGGFVWLSQFMSLDRYP